MSQIETHIGKFKILAKGKNNILEYIKEHNIEKFFNINTHYIIKSKSEYYDILDDNILIEYIEHRKEPEYINGKEVLRYDFQGWPMFKQTVKDFLDNLGIEIASIKDKSILNKPLVLKMDDGMAYCSKSNFVEDVCDDEDEVQLWYF